MLIYLKHPLSPSKNCVCFQVRIRRGLYGVAASNPLLETDLRKIFDTHVYHLLAKMKRIGIVQLFLSKDILREYADPSKYMRICILVIAASKTPMPLCICKKNQKSSLRHPLIPLPRGIRDKFMTADLLRLLHDLWYNVLSSDKNVFACAHGLAGESNVL
jgi:hypothetical protein